MYADCDKISIRTNARVGNGEFPAKGVEMSENGIIQ